MVDLVMPDADDEVFLLELIERHQKLTGSLVAARLIEAWPATQATAFAKVMPRQYRKVLEAIAAARAEGVDEVEAVMAASRT
jgi:glutamate synthase (NADPH/NADH) large chain